MKRKTPLHLSLLVVSIFLLLALFTRFLGNSYDSYGHLHPDERWLVMVVGRMHFPDNLNPDFFAYGALPMYILKIIAQTGQTLLNKPLDSYDGLLVLGRGLVSVMDVVMAGIVGVITWQVTRHKKTALLGSLLYILFFFPIQNSNFFIVDNFVNFFWAASLIWLFAYLKKPKFWLLLGLAITLAATLSSKITPVIFVPPVLALLVAAHLKEMFIAPQPRSEQLLESILKQLDDQIGVGQATTSKLPNQRLYYLLRLTLHVVLFCAILGLGTYLFMPYSFIHFDQFAKELTAQTAMNKNAYVFPYTLQYVETTAYLYHIKQLFWWGAGPILFTLGVFGSGVVLLSTWRRSHLQYHRWLGSSAVWRKKIEAIAKTAIQVLTTQYGFVYLLLSLLFFAIIGQSAVKFMRYLLLLYPFLAVMAAVALAALLGTKRWSFTLSRTLVLLLLATATVWLISFLHIFQVPHTRIQATDWMLSHIPAGSVVATEHWDDRLPLHGSETYMYEELPLYERPDDATKWKGIKAQLEHAQYVVLASNRLFTPLPKLANCARFSSCYPRTSQYYTELFDGSLGFTKVAEFTSRPTLPSFLGNLEILDDNADESFSVYDHPHVIIFQKTQPEALDKLLR